MERIVGCSVFRVVGIPACRLLGSLSLGLGIFTCFRDGCLGYSADNSNCMFYGEDM